MAYYIRSLQILNQASDNHYDTFMVAEHAFNDPREEENQTKFIGDIMPIEFEPLEAERRIKVEIANTTVFLQRRGSEESNLGGMFLVT